MAWILVFDLSKEKFLEVDFFDVGQGEAILIQTPQGHQILIDGGPNSKILEKLKKTMPFWDRVIDLVILTHPETDHLTGLLEVLKKYKIENILWTGVVKKTPEYKEWERLIQQEKAKTKIAIAGQRVFCEGCDWEIEILYPKESFFGVEMEDTNNTSIVAKLNFEKISFLFTGDVYKEGEEKILETKENLKSLFLKVAHHGSKTSSSENFIEKVLPKIAIISLAKDNKYGHPHQEVLEIFKKFGIKVLRTDIDGDIKIISDGLGYEISNFQNKN